MSQVVTSFANPVVKRVRALRQRKHRVREGAFVVEGLQPVWRAVASAWPVEVLVVAPGLLVNEAARRMVAEQAAQGRRVVDVGDAVFAHLSERDGPAGLLAIVTGSVGELDAFEPAADGPVLALDRPGNPGNVGTLVRTADAAGAAGLIVVEPAADPLSPTAIKAAMGSTFAVPLARARGVDAVLDWAQAHARPVVAVTGHAREGLWEADLDPAGVLLLGSEGAGLADDVAARCACAVAIPMGGTAESLNLSVAGSLALYEVRRRRAHPAH